METSAPLLRGVNLVGILSVALLGAQFYFMYSMWQHSKKNTVLMNSWEKRIAELEKKK